jgi:Subtilase family
VADRNTGGSSTAAAHVTGAVALLYQYQNQQVAQGNFRFFVVHHYGMKAVILNSADKEIGVQGSIKTVLNYSYHDYLTTDAGTRSDISLDKTMGVAR